MEINNRPKAAIYYRVGNPPKDCPKGQPDLSRFHKQNWVISYTLINENTKNNLNLRKGDTRKCQGIKRKFFIGE